MTYINNTVQAEKDDYEASDIRHERHNLTNPPHTVGHYLGYIDSSSKKVRDWHWHIHQRKRNLCCFGDVGLELIVLMLPFSIWNNAFGTTEKAARKLATFFATRKEKEKHPRSRKNWIVRIHASWGCFLASEMLKMHAYWNKLSPKIKQLKYNYPALHRAFLMINF